MLDRCSLPFWEGMYYTTCSFLTRTKRDAMGNKLFLFVGPKAIGGTYLITRFCSAYPKLFCEVRSTTTRLPRPYDANDRERYTFLCKDEFLKRKAAGSFFETDTYNGEFYGTSREDIDTALSQSHALMKITAMGASAIAKHLGDSCVVIFLVPESDEMLKKNFSRRYHMTKCADHMQTDLERAHEYLSYMQTIMNPHEVIHMSGTDTDLDSVQRILNAYGAK